MVDSAGKDGTEVFFSLHRQEVLDKWRPKLCIGRIAESESVREDHVTYDELSNVPYAEPTESPYMTDSHREYKKVMRKWSYERLHLTGIAEKHEKSGERIPDELFHEMGRLGILAARLGPGSHMELWRERIAGPGENEKKIMGVVAIEDFDYFHEMITHTELARAGCPGFYSGLGDGMVIGLPPVKQFGPEWMKEKNLVRSSVWEKSVLLWQLRSHKQDLMLLTSLPARRRPLVENILL